MKSLILMQPSFKAFRLMIVAITAIALLVAFRGVALADDGAQGFVEKEHQKLTALLRQPASGARDGQVTKELEAMVDYDELARRAFGQPCPAAVPGCTNHWNELNEAQRAEVKGLLKQLVEKNYRKNLIKTLDYDILFKGSKDQGTDARIRTEAKSKLKPRDPAVQVDYIVQSANGSFHVVDIVTEGSSLTKNYYDQFHKMLTNPAQGYAYVVKKLQDKLAKPD